MIKPAKPKKPIKPKLKEPSKQVIDNFYLYWVTKYVKEGDKFTSTNSYQFIKDDLVPYDEYGEPDGDYCKSEDIELSQLLEWLKDRKIDIKNVTISNEVYYRKNDGQLVLEVSRCLSDEDYEDQIKNNKRLLDKYELDKNLYPGLLKEYKNKKKLWDIHQAELKLQKLKGT